MLITLMDNVIKCFLIKIYPNHYEFKTIERVNSSGSFIEYSSDDEN